MGTIVVDSDDWRDLCDGICVHWVDGTSRRRRRRAEAASEGLSTR